MAAKLALAAFVQRGIAAQDAVDAAIAKGTSATPPSPPTNYRLQGIALALGALARYQLEPDLTAMVLNSLGLTVKDLEAAGADPL